MHAFFILPQKFSSILAGLVLLSCTSHILPAGSATVARTEVSSPSCIVYRTRSDCSKNIPVILSDDRKRIESYPDIKDICFEGKLSYPTVLAEGYLLDNRGIGPRVAFLSYTYEEYSQLVSTPPARVLMLHIIDDNPVEVMYNCGRRSNFDSLEMELNAIIKSGKLDGFPKLR
jgi:hypothetical protein